MSHTHFPHISEFSFFFWSRVFDFSTQTPISPICRTPLFPISQNVTLFFVHLLLLCFAVARHLLLERIDELLDGRDVLLPQLVADDRQVTDRVNLTLNV